jgi:uncharacterized membrane protein
VNEATLVTIAGMAAVTYATRASGLWLGNLIEPGSKLDSVLGGLPGVILVSLVAPAMVAAGVRGVVAGLATVGTAMWLRGHIFIPMAVGVLAILGLRLL